MKTRKKAFTLIELMVVIAIIAILAVLLIPKAKYYVDQSKKTGVEQNRRTLLSLTTSYYEKNYDNSTNNTDRVQKTYDKLIKLNDINNLQNPLDKDQTGLGLIIGNAFTNQGKAGYIFTDTPDSTKIPEGVVYVILKDGVISNVGENTSTEISSTPSKFPLLSRSSYTTSCYIPTPSTLYTTGYNERGQLGIGTSTNSSVFQKVDLPDNIKIADYSHNDYNSYILTTDGDIYATGLGAYGSFGLGTTVDQTSYVKLPIPNNEKVVKFYGDNDQLLFVQTPTKTYVSGYMNTLTALIGSKTTNSTFKEVILPGGVSVVDIISTKYSELMFIGSDNNVYVTGRNDGGQLGIGNTSNQTTLNKMILPEGVKAKSVKSKYNNTYVLTMDNELYACGLNIFGECGVGTIGSVTTPMKISTPNNAKVIDFCPTEVALFVQCDDGKLYACGDNRSAYTTITLGIGIDVPSVSSLKEVILPKDSKIKAIHYTSNTMSDEYITIVLEGNRIFTSYSTDIITKTFNEIVTPDGSAIKDYFMGDGFFSIFVISKNGKCYACGDDRYNQLGLGYAADSILNLKDIIIPSGEVPKIFTERFGSTLMLTESGNIYYTGIDDTGCTGSGEFGSSATTFTKVNLP